MEKRVLWVQNSVWLSYCPCLKLLWWEKRLNVKETKQNVWTVLILTVANVSFTKYSHLWMHISISSSCILWDSIVTHLKERSWDKNSRGQCICSCFIFFMHFEGQQDFTYNVLSIIISVDSMNLISAPVTSKKPTLSLQ